MVQFFLPTRLSNAGDETVGRETAEANPAHAELAVYGPRAAADFAAEPDANQIARTQLRLGRLAPVQIERFHLLAKSGRFGVG